MLIFIKKKIENKVEDFIRVKVSDFTKKIKT